ncbi:MAG: ComEC/Rec2 family competence protein, partial [Deltaproteobacteria bacterium]|nr:ComEC/Rec2 family competence protein [Deltaproteobacteria bacterium]
MKNGIKERLKKILAFPGGSLSWMPFGILLPAGAAYVLFTPGSSDMFLLLLAGLLVGAYFLGRSLWSPALITLALLSPILAHYLIQLPRAAVVLPMQNGITGGQVPGNPDAGLTFSQGEYLRIEGVIRQREELTPSDEKPGDNAKNSQQVSLLLGELRIMAGGLSTGPGPETLTVEEAGVVFPAKSGWAFQQRRRVALGGVLRFAQMENMRLHLYLDGVEHQFITAPEAFSKGESLRIWLRDRAAYYLSKETLAVYLPVVLGLRERTDPEAREITGVFRRVGVSHLFAISGLHVGLLYGIVLGAMGVLARFFSRGQGRVHGLRTRRAVSVALIWLYLALIGFPYPAVR